MDKTKLEEFARIVITRRIDIDDLIFSMDYEEYYEQASDYYHSNILDVDQVLSEEEYNICMEVVREYENKR